MFETNSSSTHAIVTSFKTELVIPSELVLECGEFGWEVETYDSPNKKASYFYTAVKNLGFEEQFNNVLLPLLREKTTVTIVERPKDEYYRNGYIDHDGELYGFINHMMTYPDLFISFIFGVDSFIKTGNDNSLEDGPYDEVSHLRHSSSHYIYFKGN